MGDGFEGVEPKQFQSAAAGLTKVSQGLAAMSGLVTGHAVNPKDFAQIGASAAKATADANAVLAKAVQALAAALNDQATGLTNAVDPTAPASYTAEDGATRDGYLSV
jgi:hypothetical protein